MARNLDGSNGYACLNHLSHLTEPVPLGYTNNESAIEPLAQLANHEDVTIRLCALSSLGLLGATEYFELFKEKYNTSKIGEKSMALKAIGDLGTDDAYAFLEAVRSSPAYEDIMIKEVVDLYLN